jgi:hypothetical protein
MHCIVPNPWCLRARAVFGYEACLVCLHGVYCSNCGRGNYCLDRIKGEVHHGLRDRKSHVSDFVKYINSTEEGSEVVSSLAIVIYVYHMPQVALSSQK